MQPISVVKKQDIVTADRWKQQRPERALTLPSRYFYDDAVFAAERDRIFMSAWHVIGHTSELSTPGQFVMTDVFDQSVIAACGRDGQVHAFHNVCQHRGNRLVEARRGEQKGLFRCAYHSWCYGADGSLRGAPRTDRVEDFDLAAHNIPKVRIEELGGFYYFNLDPDAPSMRDLFPGADAEMKRVFPKLDAYRLIEEKDVIVPANWKVIMDNSIEGYHFSLSGPHHVELAGLIDFAGYRLTQHDKWWTYIAPANRDATSAYGVPLGDRNPDECFFNIGIWPHNTFYTFPYSDFLATFLIIPLEPEKTLLRFGYYSTHDAVPAVTKACMDWMNTDLGPEDIRLNISVQKGLHSMGYNQGRYVIDAQRSNESEHLVHHFHTLVHDGIHGA
ncbi:(2Fe-2S)-binding protein [Burkholderia aenigmatica]|uniref:(2Fe-2S)-binding protein n=1 Tax=Burkholderia aenigmatica TaxID=2015348 RepID=A0A6P2HMN3_9BURK|nr:MULTISPECIES: aromatic ring-hydroxylating dioxygenase subunit alpha [Burkholderia]MDN7520028.1 aromatic ring-hydroxylating dioxygenase subunit alpha [Burkholderia sp. AU45251]VWB19335.1 (2Fe-2S)-binding protein [Burkholderia aenigmatica]HDR9487067.1 aromatic ring-hydroxylating dioxygenase subunit alpha [Burkholderia aenigmatica]HDR9518950.1 aromatic ring-hydroxylating dioxygenase subunit alpha [Burkholderia aenigmatica]HDR9595817.1 aromatic ring-hydroxylating dioxygenase subunit alpha [Burk